MALNTLEHAAVNQTGSQFGFGRRLRRTFIATLAAVGLVVPAYLVGAAASDIASTDQTSGGYVAPYTDFTGTPIQPDQTAVEGDQLIIRGRVLDSEISCRTGLWVFDIVGFDIPYRPVSERALVVHRPQDVCRVAGFDTAAWDLGY
jgi:hypothetical protein